MPLHPDLDAFLELVNDAHADGTALHTMTPAQARTAYDRSTLALDLPGAEVSSTSLTITARDGHALPARLYPGCASAPRPTLLFFHGGGYVLGGLDSHDSLCRDLADLADCAVLAVDYRRAPEHRFPTAFEDAQDAAAWVREHAARQGLDASRLAYGGDSVGGTLATALALADRAADLPQPVLQLLLYPCVSAHQDSPSHHRLASGHLLEARTLQWMFAHYLRNESDRLDWRFAPLQAHSLHGLAPTHLALAEFDPLIDEGLAYAEALRSAGVRVSTKVYPGMVHDFARLGNVVEDAAVLRRDLAAVLTQAFR
ncbi:alpha/beta hydrolase [Roseateles amylovorans]|uniref:Alpha/beta hydrolase n=1 Tax=Roseateles amylovorans TaxID=2978473 RepID=A0ABY6ASK5_9BURK|nr:alpha/beta hydrolase [Roseateles amylovorans]UXH76216.1 alpha/beta hydrolase [Roseateles amylovorans]